MHNRNLTRLFARQRLMTIGGRSCGHVRCPAGAAQCAWAFLKPAQQSGNVESLQRFQISVHVSFTPPTRKTPCSVTFTLRSPQQRAESDKRDKSRVKERVTTNESTPPASRERSAVSAGSV